MSSAAREAPVAPDVYCAPRTLWVRLTPDTGRMNYVEVAIPFFILAMAVEYLYGKLVKRQTYRLDRKSVV